MLHIPGQASVPHATVSLSSPGHSDPFRQVLVFVCVPPPHVTEQSSVVQGVQTKNRSYKIEYFSFSNVIEYYRGQYELYLGKGLLSKPLSQCQHLDNLSHEDKFLICFWFRHHM